MMVESLNYSNLTLSSTKDTIAAFPARIHGFELVSINTDDVFIVFYDALAADVTVGSTTPDSWLFLPASDGTNRTGKDGYLHFAEKFTKGIVVAAIKAAAGVSGPSGSTAPTTSVAVLVRYS